MDGSRPTVSCLKIEPNVSIFPVKEVRKDFFYSCYNGKFFCLAFIYGIRINTIFCHFEIYLKIFLNNSCILITVGVLSI